MMFNHYIVARESVPQPALVGLMAAAIAVPVVVGLLGLLNVLAAAEDQAVLWFAIAGLVAAYFLGWQIPVQYVLTDTHLVIGKGWFRHSWVPLDRIYLLCRISRDNELIYSGVCALGKQGEPLIINPHLAARFRVAFTPGPQFIEDLFRLINRQDFDVLPGQDEGSSAGQA